MATDLSVFEAKAVKRLEKYANTFNLNFTIDKLDRLFEKNRLTQTQVDFIKGVKKVLDETVPDRYDIQFQLTPLFGTVENTYGSNHERHFPVVKGLFIERMYVVIHHPLVTITNTKKQTLELKDLYTRFPVRLAFQTNDDNGLPTGFKNQDWLPRQNFAWERIQGVRATVNTTEFAVGYLHSHLQSRNYNTDSRDKSFITEFTNFCTGEGDINMVQSMLNADYDPDTLKLLVLQAENFVAWESIQGGPHIRMEKVIEKDYDYPDVSRDAVNSFWTTVKYHLMDKRRNPPKLDWKLTGGQFRIVDNERFEDFLIGFQEGHANRFIFKDDEGNYFVQSELKPTYVKTWKQWFPLRNEKIFFKVEGEIKVSKDNAKKYLHPKIKTYVKSKLEHALNSQKIRQVGIERLYPSHH